MSKRRPVTELIHQLERGSIIHGYIKSAGNSCRQFASINHTARIPRNVFPSDPPSRSIFLLSGRVADQDGRSQGRDRPSSSHPRTFASLFPNYAKLHEIRSVYTWDRWPVARRGFFDDEKFISSGRFKRKKERRGEETAAVSLARPFRYVRILKYLRPLEPRRPFVLAPERNRRAPPSAFCATVEGLRVAAAAIQMPFQLPRGLRSPSGNSNTLRALMSALISRICPVSP